MTFSRAARYALLACLAAGGAPWARAQVPDTTLLRLDVLLAEAVDANPTLQAARLDAAARAQVAAQVGALPDPSFAVTAFPYPLVTALGAQRSQWRVEQMVPWPGTRALRARSATLAADAATHDAQALALDLLFEVRRAYYTLYTLQRTDALVRAFVQRLDAFGEAAAVRYEVGRGPQGAILRVGLEKERLRARLLDLDSRRYAALQTLARLTDRPALALADGVVVNAPEASVSHAVPDKALPDTSRAWRPERRALEAERARSEAEIALARKAFYPDLGIGVTYFDLAPRAMPPTAVGTDALALMVSARVPLGRSRLRARVAETYVRKEQIDARIDALETAITAEVAEARYATRRHAEAIDLYRTRLVPQAQATVESVLAAYTTGEADYAALLDAERARFEVQLDLEEAIGRYLDATARFARALGQLPDAPPPSRR